MWNPVFPVLPVACWSSPSVFVLRCGQTPTPTAGKNSPIRSGGRAETEPRGSFPGRMKMSFRGGAAVWVEYLCWCSGPELSLVSSWNWIFGMGGKHIQTHTSLPYLRKQSWFNPPICYRGYLMRVFWARHEGREALPPQTACTAALWGRRQLKTQEEEILNHVFHFFNIHQSSFVIFFSLVKHQIMKSLCCPALDYLQQTWPGCGGGSVSTDCVFPHWRYLDRLQGLSCTQKSSAQTQHVVLQVMIQHKWDPSARLMLPDCLSLCVDLHVQSSHRDPLWARKMIFARFWMLLSFWEADAVHSQFPQRQS